MAFLINSYIKGSHDGGTSTTPKPNEVVQLMKPIYLYYLIDEDDKVRYVGITSRVKQRMSAHKKEKPKHTFELIEHFDNPEDAGLAEQNHIMRHDTFDNGWNKSIGGETVLSGKNHPNYIHGLWGTPEYNKKYYQDNKEYIKEKMANYYQDNKEKVKERTTMYTRNNRDKVNARRKIKRKMNRQYLQSVNYYVDNTSENARANKRRYRENNVDKCREASRKSQEKRRHPCLCLFTGMVY